MQILKKKQTLELLQELLPLNPIIIEAGAFDGRDTKLLSAMWPEGTIHAFEPVPEIFALLEKNTEHLPNVKRYPFALSDSTGSAKFYVSSKPKFGNAPFQAGSLLKPKERLKFSDVQYKSTLEVPTMTLDQWAHDNHITQIDFLWLDMQGYELNVLKAAPRMLQTVQAIYTEVEFVEAYEGQYLYEDVKRFLYNYNFIDIAQDFSDTTSWFFGNVLFYRDTR